MSEAASTSAAPSAPVPKPTDSSPAPAAPLALAGLTDPQQAALAALPIGRTIRDAAKSIGVNRNTVAGWLRADSRFRAAYNAWRQELIDSTRSRLLRTAELAAAAVHKQIAKGDGRLALALLDRLALASEAAATAGAPDADLARDEIAVERTEQVHAVQRRVQSTRAFHFWSEDREHLDALRRQIDQHPRPADDATD